LSGRLFEFPEFEILFPDSLTSTFLGELGTNQPVNARFRPCFFQVKVLKIFQGVPSSLGSAYRGFESALFDRQERARRVDRCPENERHPTHRLGLGFGDWGLGFRVQGFDSAQET